MTEELLTVGEIAERIAPAKNARAIARIVRQLRYWTLTHALAAVGGPTTGRGKHRQYSGDAVYLAALLAELSRKGFPIGVLHMVGVSLISVIRPLAGQRDRWAIESRKLWYDAMQGERRIYLTFDVELDEEGEHFTSGGLSIYDPDEPDARYPVAADNCSAHVVDLTRLFARIKK